MRCWIKIKANHARGFAAHHIIVIISCLNRRTGSCRESHDTKEGLVLDAGANGCKHGSRFILTEGKV
jgi:hypothetical protein